VIRKSIWRIFRRLNNPCPKQRNNRPAEIAIVLWRRGVAMIEKIIRFSVGHRGFVLGASILVAVAGVFAAFHTPMDAVPDLSENQVIVFTNWPGHAPPEVFERITQPLSQQLQGLEGVRVVRGSSDMGYSMLHVIFQDDVSHSSARQRVQERVATLDVKLPDGVRPTLAADGIPTGQIYWYTVEGTGYDLPELRSIQDSMIAPQLQSLQGVAEVASIGGFQSELYIQAEPELLAQYGLTLRDLEHELSQPTEFAGGHVLQKGNAEFIVQLVPSRMTSAIKDQMAEDRNEASRHTLDFWEQRLISTAANTAVRLSDVAKVSFAPAPRRGMFEKEGSEAVAGIVHLRFGHNPLEVTQNIKVRLIELAEGLPAGVRIVPCYDRTPLITGAVSTVTRTLIEALLIAAVCVLLVLKHIRAWLVIALSLPLCVLATFLAMSLLRASGIVDIQTNIMSLAGIVISIGVLVDSSIVLTENVMHQLRLKFVDQPVKGDVRQTVAAACETVGRPVFFSILVMLVSFTPVFALQGIDGRMYGPLAWTKTLALVTSAFVAITVVPALCSFLVRGRMRDESESAVVRGVISVYRPVLSSLMDRPAPLIVILCITFLLAATPLGSETVFRLVLFAALLVILFSVKSRMGRYLAVPAIVGIALIARSTMMPIGTEMRMPLNEGIVMDMPITVPRASITQTADDLKARNMVLCRFPEVQMVTGKAGRAETPFDPAPLDMIETMIEFRRTEFWPRRRLSHKDAGAITSEFLQKLADQKLIEAVSANTEREIVEAALFRFDAVQRETAFQQTEVFRQKLRNDLSCTLVEESGIEWLHSGLLNRPLQSGDIAAAVSELPVEFQRDLEMSLSLETVSAAQRVVRSSLQQRNLFSGESSAQASRQSEYLPGVLTNILRTGGSTPQSRVLKNLQSKFAQNWSKHTDELNRMLHLRSVPTWLQLVCDESFTKIGIIDEHLHAVQSQIRTVRNANPNPSTSGAHHHGIPPLAELPIVDPHPAFDKLRHDLGTKYSRSILLAAHTADSLGGFEGEMDRALQVPGWINVWTRPIQNRVDMLTSGVSSEIGVRVMGRTLDDVVTTSEQIAAVLTNVPGATNVVADPIRGKGFIQITPNSERTAEHRVVMSDLQTTIDLAVTGRVIGEFIGDKGRTPIRLRVASQETEEDENSLRRLPVPRYPGPEAPVPTTSTQLRTIPLETVADVTVIDGPATIKSENGWLRNYVRFNVQDRSPFEVVEESRGIVRSQVETPPGVFIEWTGQFQHAADMQRMLMLLVPIVLILILLILYLTYRDWADAALMMLSAPGALAGGVLCQWLLGYKFSIAVGVGYIACFGMAASTGIVMLVYLREAVDKEGGLQQISLEQLKNAVFTGAVHRLRPKLLTEATTILSLAPMLWSTGVGAEVIRPMAAPVLGGILIADEVIDLLLPVLFFQLRRRRWIKIHGKSGEQATS
jgi:Cu(I)/Ag(I) efflux system membrane protein CusA/SilA